MKTTLPINANYAKNERRCHGDNWPCIICGNPIKDHSKARQLHIGYGGSFVISENDPGIGNDGDIGFFPIGPECVRQHPELKPFLA